MTPQGRRVRAGSPGTAVRRRDVLKAGAALAGVAAAGACSQGDGEPTAATTAAPSTSGPATKPLRFPRTFLWGAATSAYQVEGAAAEDGRGPSVWDTFAHEPGRTANGDTGDVSADQYHRYKQDVALMSELGLQSYRFSISWSRVMPTGKGVVNQKGLDYYKRLVDTLGARDIQPMATLWHWDTPQALQDDGGWENRDTASYFGDYAGVIFDALGDTVPRFVTLNEPKTVVNVGYRFGVHAPGLTDDAAAATALHHMHLGHGKAVQALRASGSRAEIAPCFNLMPIYPADDSPEAKSATISRDALENRIYLDPVLRGFYPEDGFETVDERALRAAIHDGDLEIISNPVDFLAVNYYNPFFVDGDGDTIVRHEIAEPASWLEIYPEGLYDLLTRLASDYGDLRMTITESGRPDSRTYPQVDGHFADDDRITFLHDHFVQAHRAIQNGVRLEGYHVWSLLDNFEWAAGLEQRWGIVHVDFASQKRTTKKSARWYQEVIAANAV